MSRDPQLSETSGCLCLASRRAARTITRRFDRALRPHGLRATQFSLLATLVLKGPQTIGALAEFIGADRTTLTRNLAVAEEHGLIALRPGKDARSRIASITTAGRQRLQRALPAWRETQDGLTDVIGIRVADSLRRLSREPAMRTSREMTR
jgi:DNA-binding MarR family transcriptional regulator